MRNTLEYAKALAKSKCGKCLSTVYENRRSMLMWQCGFGHKPWSASYSNVLSGTWCPTCAHSIRGTIEDMSALAKSRGGRCLSEEFLNFHVPLRWRCAKGHEWMAAPNSVVSRGRREGTWCPDCTHERLRGKKRPDAPTIDDMRRLARSRGGRCTSEFYINARTDLQWACAKGHTWTAKPPNVQRGSWCPFCAGKAPRTLGDMQELAAIWYGRCLSEQFQNMQSPVNWICSEGHEFTALPRNVLRGHWCPHCVRNAPGSLDKMRCIAAEHGGTCLSTRYVNAHSRLKWRCARGHEWFAEPYRVTSGDWCVRCYRERGGQEAR